MTIAMELQNGLQNHIGPWTTQDVDEDELQESLDGWADLHECSLDYIGDSSIALLQCHDGSALCVYADRSVVEGHDCDQHGWWPSDQPCPGCE